MRGGEEMKQLWSEPQITEIKVKMTEDNKLGTEHDKFTDATDLCGNIIPCPCS
jgi:hypothetical protein